MKNIDNWEKEYNKKFYSNTDQTCTWHQNDELREFIRQVEQSAIERTKEDIVEIIDNYLELPIADMTISLCLQEIKKKLNLEILEVIKS